MTRKIEIAMKKKFTAPLQEPAIPCPRTFRHAHILMEMQNIDRHRDVILSTFGTILKMDATCAVLNKVYGEGAGTMKYLTSIINEHNQFLIFVISANESEESYATFIHLLIRRFTLANVPTPLVLYVDFLCCQ